MKLIVPYIEELQPVDLRLLRLAEFLGIDCEALPLAKSVGRYAEQLETVALAQRSCIAVNPSVMKEWTGGDTLPPALVSCLLTKFSRVIVHGVRENACDSHTVAALSHGRLQSVRAVGGTNSAYEIAKNSTDVCGPFASLSFGPVNPANDRVFVHSPGEPGIRSLISIGDSSFMAVVEENGSEIFFLGSEDVAALDAEAGDAPATEFFSRLVPHAMALRHIFGDECWQPGHSCASVIIDDPLLRRNYGFLNFETLLALMKQHNFHTTMAFIPHNFRRSSAQVTRMFRDNRDCFSLCYHGNDHTGAEFSSADKTFLNSSLHIAESRMKIHHELTGLACDKVMVFPQGKFSVEAMQVLKSRNFYAAVNTTTHPMNDPVRLTIADLAQPAVLRYGGFPLFIRRPSRQTQVQDIAFDVFFGKPVVIVEHHDIFKNPDPLAEAVSRINAVAPNIRWSNIADAVDNSILERRAPDGKVHVQAYSGTVRILNDSVRVEQYSIEWNWPSTSSPVDQVLRNGTPIPRFDAGSGKIQVESELPPGGADTFSVVYRK